MNPETPGVSLNSISFKLLWWSSFLNTFGVAFSAGAISVLTVQELKLPDSYVPLMLGFSSIAAALAAIPTSPWVETRRKRPILVGASFFRGTLLVLIAVLAWVETLTFPFLTLCLVLISLSGIVSGAANGVHLRDLVRQEDWPQANGIIE